MDFAEKIAQNKGYKLISLNVDKENPRAQQLYVHKGYKSKNEMTIGDRTYSGNFLILSISISSNICFKMG